VAHISKTKPIFTALVIRLLVGTPATSLFAQVIP